MSIKWKPIDNTNKPNSFPDKKWIEYCESEEANLEWGTIIGTFTIVEDSTEEDSVNEGSVGRFQHSHEYIVYIHPNEGTIAHFHVFDKAGMHRDKTHKDGFHTCVEIKTNNYFRHEPYTDYLDKNAMKALDNFMGQIRGKNKSDAGFTNFAHTITEWNDNNAQDEESDSPYWVDPNTPKPDYTTLIDNDPSLPA